MPLTEIRPKLAQILKDADPASPVHDYVRWATDPETVRGFFASKVANDPRWRGWIVHPVRKTEAPATHDDVAVDYEFELTFVYSLTDADASEQACWDLLDRVSAHLRGHALLNTERLSTLPAFGSETGRIGLQVEKVEAQKVSQVLCHVATCRLVIEELVSRTAA